MWLFMGLLKATFNGINIKLRLNKDLQYTRFFGFMNDMIITYHSYF